MIKVSDYVMNFLVEKGIKDVFLVSGGNSMHLLDSLGSHPNLNYYCNHHEQASAMSAEGYARITKNFGVCLVSSGPAQTNALTGLMCAWEDSIPVMFISGNSNSTQLKGKTGLRQRGVHEVDILPMVEDVTKYALRLSRAEDIQFEMESLYYWMMEGRKGPVWIDIPVDIQGEMIDEAPLYHFDPQIFSKKDFTSKSSCLTNLFNEADRPVILIGGGAIERIPEISKWANSHCIPMVCTKNAYGYINKNTTGYMGMIGINGNRGANLTIQNADLVLILGSRLSLPSIGYATDQFVHGAKKIMVDIDNLTINCSFVNLDLSFNMDISDFIYDILFDVNISVASSKWRDTITHSYGENIDPINRRFVIKDTCVDAYNFYMALSKVIPENTILVTDQGAAFYAWSQAFIVDNTISFTNGGFSPMGYGLPAAIGACIANSKKPTICVTGDGGFEMNIQELQTIIHYNLPIKIFVFDNNGYGSIRNTQDTYFEGRYIGSSSDSGVTTINARSIADAYGIDTYNILNDTELYMLDEAFQSDRPVVVHVQLDYNQKIEPKVMAIKNADGTIKPGLLEDMTPLLNRETFKKLMIVKPVGG